MEKSLEGRSVDREETRDGGGCDPLGGLVVGERSPAGGRVDGVESRRRPLLRWTKKGSVGDRSRT